MKIFPSNNWPESSTGRSGILPGLAWAGKLAYQKIAGFAALGFLVASLIIVPFWQTGQAGPSLQPSSPSEPTQTLSPEKTGESFGQLPLSFESNQGQLDKQVRFQSQGSGYSLYLTAQEIVINLNKSAPQANTEASLPGKEILPARGNMEQGQSQTTSLHMNWLGGNPSPVVSGTEKQAGITNYLLGNDPSKWHTNIANYGKVDYQEVYPGIDLTFYGNQRHLEYDFVVKAQASPDAIRLGFEGTTGLEIDGEGNLVVHTASGDLSQPAPKLYQEINGSRQAVSGRFKLVKQPGQKQAVLGFEVSAYDTTRPLVIDPTLVYSTYLGGSSDDTGNSIAVDSAGNTYITGVTSSSNFPTHTPYQAASGDGGSYGDAFITKLSPGGNSLVYSTYLGGSSRDGGNGIAVDSGGNAYITGFTSSSNFPTQNAYQPGFGYGSEDAFVAKLNASGNGLVYSTYLGGSSDDTGKGIAVDSTGNAYITGYTGSSTFPTQNPYQPVFGGYRDAFVTKLNPGGNGLVYSTYMGSNDDDEGQGIAVDSGGNAYITGFTGSSTFPTHNPYQPALGGGSSFDAFVTKLSPSGNALVYSTYLGGSSYDEGQGIAIDSAGNAYITGYTHSSTFPTHNPYQPALSSVYFEDAFVTKLNAGGNSLVYSTYLGGSYGDEGQGIAVDSGGNAYITGFTGSSDFPTHNAYQPASGSVGNNDAFVTKLNASGNALVYSTYLGGSSGDEGQGIAVDSNGNTYITGYTGSSDFPTHNPLQPTSGGNSDVFVARIQESTKTCTVNNTSDNAATAGTFRNALSQSPQCDIITFTFASATTINVTGSPLPNVPVGVTINGVCNAGLPIITINGSGITGTGLYLSGGDTVNCLIIQGFNGVQLKAVSGAGAGQNTLLHVKVSKN